MSQVCNLVSIDWFIYIEFWVLFDWSDVNKHCSFCLPLSFTFSAGAYCQIHNKKIIEFDKPFFFFLADVVGTVIFK